MSIHTNLYLYIHVYTYIYKYTFTYIHINHLHKHMHPSISIHLLSNSDCVCVCMYKQVYVPLKSNDQLLCDVIICVFAENRTKKQIYGVVFFVALFCESLSP